MIQAGTNELVGDMRGWGHLFSPENISSLPLLNSYSFCPLFVVQLASV